MPIAARVRNLWHQLTNRAAHDHELSDELNTFVDLLTEEKVRAGANPDAARRAALLEVGGVSQVHDATQHARSSAPFERVAQDLRYALRGLRRAPAFTIAAVLVLSLGIGASTTVLSVVRGVLLRPFNYAAPEQLVVILNQGRGALAVANYLDIKTQNHSFASVGAADYWTPSLVADNNAEKLFALKLTADVIPMLGIAPELGRLWTSTNDGAGENRVAVISHRLWMRRFNSDSSAIGRLFSLDGESYQLIGVMPASFAFAPFWATKAELWAPLPLATRTTERGGSSLRVFARLLPGVSVARARGDVDGIVQRIERDFPGAAREIQVVPLADRVVGNVRTPLLMLLGAVGFVLLISCANVAHMLLARATAREREMAVRSALGAGRSRLIRQTLTESLLLATLGGAGGVLLAAIGVRLVAEFGAASIPRVQEVTLDAPALLAATLITLLCGLAFGLAPALRTAQRDLGKALRSGGRGTTAGWEGARRALIGSQFAFAVMLLVGAGLMIRSVVALRSLNPGLDPRGVVTSVMTLAGSAESAPGPRRAFYESVVEQLRALPGVEDASAINHAPLVGDLWRFGFRVEGAPALARGAERPKAAYRVVLPRYFHTMGIRLLTGRDFTAADQFDAPGVVIVNQRFAALHWPGQEAVGRRVAFAGSDTNPEWLTVVGVVANAVRSEWTAPAEEEAFLPLLQNKLFLLEEASHFAAFTLVVRKRCDATAVCNANSIVPAMRRVVASVDPTIPLSDITSMDDAIADATAEPRFYLTLLAAFAAVALLLAAVGIYGVMSYSVVQRTREVGVRLALGATPKSVLYQVLAQGMTLAVAGVTVGAIGALVLSRFMSSVLFGVTPTDPLTFAVVLSVLLVAAAAAVLVPARRATSIDPLLALRGE